MTRASAVRSVLAAVVVTSVVVTVWWLQSPAATLVKVGQQAPELELPSLGSAARSRLSSFRGHPVLLVLFLSDCRLCEAQTPEIERLHRRLLARGLTVVGVSADPRRADLVRFVEKHAITFTVLQDPGGAAMRKAYGAAQLPEAYLIDASGKVAAAWPGAVQWRDRRVLDAISALLPPQGPG